MGEAELFQAFVVEFADDGREPEEQGGDTAADEQEKANPERDSPNGAMGCCLLTGCGHLFSEEFVTQGQVR